MPTPPSLAEYMIADPAVARRMASGQGPAAAETAHRRLLEVRQRLAAGSAGPGPASKDEVAAAISDLACALLQCGDVASATKRLQEAVHLAPTSAFAFHNLTALLIKQGELRGSNLRFIMSHLDAHREHGWTARYRPLRWMPTFLNLQFIEGKCNLKCRMCIGTNAASHPDKLSYMTTDDFRRALTAAPTIDGVTLSSGDSDPLLHPKLGEIIDIAEAHRIKLDLFTNGLPLGARICRRLVESPAIGMINFSIDAATAETYGRIRGGDFERLHRNLRMLRDMKAESGRSGPVISLSFVAMADNVEELPAFIEWGRTYGARRIYVEDLIGWIGEAGGNRAAIDNPRWHESVRDATRRAADAGIFLQLPERLQTPGRDETEETPVDDVVAPAGGEHRCCSWLNGVWVSGNGDLQPCCLVNGVADMGNTADGPLYDNAKYGRVKSLLSEGKVFQQCASQTMCAFVQQEKARGRGLHFVTSEELGDLAPVQREASRPGDASDDERRIRLPVLAAS